MGGWTGFVAVSALPRSSSRFQDFAQAKVAWNIARTSNELHRLETSDVARLVLLLNFDTRLGLGAR